MATQRTPGPENATSRSAKPDTGTLCRYRSPVPGPVDLDSKSVTWSYSISGTPGALGNMLFTDGTKRLPGTWYDRTLQTNQLRSKEAAIGLSGYGDEDFRKLARKTTSNLNSPDRVDVNIHFETKNGVESILVRGKCGARSFKFDFNEVEKAAENLPKNADAFKPFTDTIDQIVNAIIQVR
jgi:hypothetical protein